MTRLWCALALALAVGACGEKEQTIGSAPMKKADAKSWQAASNAYVASGWKPGDRQSWEEHLRARTQGQNEYTRVPPR